MAFPIQVRSRRSVPTTAEAYASRTLADKLEELAPHVLRATIAFEEVGGAVSQKGAPKKSQTLCRMNVVLRRVGAVVIEARANGAREAVDRASDDVERAVRRALGPKKTTTARPAAAPRTGKRRASAPPPDGSLIGRRVGHRKDNLDDATERPEKRRRDALVDTAAPGTSASDRRAGGGSTARRNSKKDDAGMTHALEDSAKGTPSRKSTRRGTNRVKPDSQLTRRTKRAIRSPRARAEKAQARRTRPSGG